MSLATRRAEVFGELRSLLAQPPAPAVWRQLVAQLDALDDPEDLPWLREVALPYCLDGLAAWPEHLRRAPKHWLVSLVRDRDEPRMVLAERLDLDDWPVSQDEPWRQIVALWTSPQVHIRGHARWLDLTASIAEAMSLSVPMGVYTFVTEPLPDHQEATPHDLLCSRLGDVSNVWRHYDWRWGVQDWMELWLFDEIADAFALRQDVITLLADALEGWLGPIDQVVQVTHEGWDMERAALGVEATSGARVYLFVAIV